MGLRRPHGHVCSLLTSESFWLPRRPYLPANAGDMRYGFDIWVGKIPWRRKWQPIPVFLSGESHGQRSLAGYSPWGCKESGMTERLSTYMARLSKRRQSLRSAGKGVPGYTPGPELGCTDQEQTVQARGQADGMTFMRSSQSSPTPKGSTAPL